MKRLALFLLFLLPLALPVRALGANTESATIRFYRVQTFFADGYLFDVLIGKTPVYRAAVGTSREITVPAGGKIKLVTDKNKAVSLTLTPEAGQVLYVRCAAEVSGSGTKPLLVLTDAAEAEADYLSATPTEAPVVIAAEEPQTASAQLLAAADQRAYPLFHIDLSTGFSHRDTRYMGSWEANESVHDGLVLSGDFMWNFRENMCVGLKAGWQHATLKDQPCNATVKYFGPAFATRRLFNADRSHLEGGLAICYTQYVCQSEEEGLRGSSFGGPMAFFCYGTQLIEFLDFTTEIDLLGTRINKYTTWDSNGNSTFIDNTKYAIGVNFVLINFSVGLRVRL